MRRPASYGRIPLARRDELAREVCAPCHAPVRDEHSTSDVTAVLPAAAYRDFSRNAYHSDARYVLRRINHKERVGNWDRIFPIR